MVTAGVVAGSAGVCVAASGGASAGGMQTAGGRILGAPVEQDIAAVVVYRSSGVTSLTLTNGVRLHLKVMPKAGKSGQTGKAAVDDPATQEAGPGIDAGAAKQIAQRVSIHAFIPVRQGVTASGHALGHEVGMLAAAVLNATPRPVGDGAGDPAATVRAVAGNGAIDSAVATGATGASGASGATDATGAAGQTLRQFGLACWLGADGLHIRLACEQTDLSQALEKLRAILTRERVDATVFAATHEKELRRLREGRSPERDVMDRLLAAVNPAYRRPDATVIATVTLEEVEQWLAVTIGSVAPELAAAGNNSVRAATPVVAAPLDIGIAGRIDAAMAGAMAAETFGNLSRRVDVLAERVGPVSRAGEVTIEQPAETNRGLLLLAWEAPPIHELGPYRASLGATRLLRERLRAKLLEQYPSGGADGQRGGTGNWPGAATIFDVSCRLMPGPELLPSTAIVRITVANAKTTPGFMAEVAALVCSQIDAMANRGGTPSGATNVEADTVTDPLVADSTRLLASAEYWASILATHRQVGLDPDELITAPRAYDALNGVDLTRAVADWLDRGPRLRLLEWPGLER